MKKKILLKNTSSFHVNCIDCLRLCDHLKENEKQITSSNSKFLNTLKKSINGEIKVEERNHITKKLGFVNVIDAFHEVNGKTIPKRFFIDERKENSGIRLTDHFYKLFELQESENYLVNQKISSVCIFRIRYCCRKKYTIFNNETINLMYDS